MHIELPQFMPSDSILRHPLAYSLSETSRLPAKLFKGLETFRGGVCYSSVSCNELTIKNFKVNVDNLARILFIKC